MFGEAAAHVTSRCVVVSVLFRYAPFAGDEQIAIIIRPAAFERDKVLNLPIVGGPKLALALVALAVAAGEHARHALRGHASAFGVVERVHTFIARKLLSWVRHASIFIAAASRRL